MCDSGNNRILRLDTDLKVTGCYTGFTGSTEISVGEDGRSTFLNPNGIYVKRASLMISFMFTSQIQTIQGLLSVLLSQAQK